MSGAHLSRNETESGNDKCEKENMIKVEWRTFGFKSSCSLPFNLKSDEVHFLDRSYMPGEVIQSLETNMIGTVSNVYMTAHAEILDHQRVMFDIQCDHLRSVYPWTTHVDENYVIWNSWLGRVSDCRLMAIIRFLDGARLLVGDNCLECFEPFLSAPDEYMNNNYEGIWLIGDALELRSSTNSSKSSKFDFLSLPVDSSSDKCRNMDKSTNLESTPPSNVYSNLHSANETFPLGHPIKFLQALAQYPVTKTFARHPEQITCLLKRTPIFLVETPSHNSVWLSRLKSSVDVVFCVEHFAPVEATVHWFANRSSQSDKPPPRVIHGLDLGNLKSVVSNSFINCQVGDIWYYKLQESDKIYDMRNFTRPEQLLYKWFTNDISGLGVGSSLPPPLHDDKQKTDQDSLNENCIASKSKIKNLIPESSPVTESKSSESLTEEKMSSKTTPFWAQVNLFASRRRRRRVTIGPRHRILRTDIFLWANRFHRSTPSFTPYIDISADISDHDDGTDNDKNDTLRRTKHQSQTQDQKDQQIEHIKENNHQVVNLTCKRISCDNSKLVNKSVLSHVENITKIDLSLKSLPTTVKSGVDSASSSPPPLMTVTVTSSTTGAAAATPTTTTTTTATTTTTTTTTTTAAATTATSTTTITTTSTTVVTDANNNTTNKNPILSLVDISFDDSVNKSTTNMSLPSSQITTVDDDHNDNDINGNHNDDDYLEEKKERNCKKTKLSKHSKRLCGIRRQAEYIQEERAIHLRTGDWVPVRIYATKSVYDIKWIDGSVSKGVTSDKILSFGGHIEHYLFPGFLVSLKSDKNCRSQPIPLNSAMNDPSSPIVTETSEKLDISPSSTIELSCDHPRDLGVALAYNTKDRTCLVQWFKTGNSKTGSMPMIPIGSPEEIGVYEISGSGEYQMNYGDTILIKSASETDYSTYPAGILEDIIPESGKLVIRWIDGTSSEVYRTDCLQAIEADDDSTDDEDSFDSDISDSDDEKNEKWDTYSTSSESSSCSQFSSTSGSCSSSKSSDNSSDNDNISVQITQPTFEDDLRPVGTKLFLASEHVKSAHRLFSDRFTFVLWLMRCFVTVSGIADDILEQVYSALRNAALIDPTELNNIRLDDSTSLKTSYTEGSTSEKPLLTRTENAWRYADEVEAISCVEMLTNGRSLLYEAFRLIRDYRIRKMWHLCDFRSNLFEKHIGAILSLFESFPLSTHEQAKLFNPVDLASFNNDLNGLNKPLDTVHVIKSSPDKQTSESDQQTLSSDSISNVSEVPSRNETIHFLLRPHRRGSKVEGLRSNYTIMISNEIIIKLAKFIHDLQKDILEQLVDLNNQIIAWLHECAAQYIRKFDINDLLINNNDVVVHHRYAIDSDKCTIEPELINDVHANNSEVNVELASKLNAVASLHSEVIPDDSPNENIPTSTAEKVKLTSLSSETENMSTEASSANFSIKSILSDPTVESLPVEQRGQFIMEPNAPSNHRFYKSSQKTLPKAFHKALRRDISLLSTILPNGMIIKGFDDRIDLYSIMIVGASGTPYEHCLFFFDIGLPSSYPTTPPQVYYYSFGNEKVNPNLYVDGHICLSLLGTWSGQGSENWSAETSNLLQLAISIQGLILNSEPYFNEAGYEERRTDPIYQEQSRIYNEAVIALNLQSMISIVQNPFPIFRNEIIKHCATKCKEYLCLLEYWASLDSVEYERIKAIDQLSNSSPPREQLLLPEFPLPPVSKGFQLSIRRHSAVLSNLVKSFLDLNDSTTTD
ncbi:unnamed protein product [Schistosoma turkestanicum]|nr:unnamed protein product [Schistosoma turkestanicum]